MSKNYIGLDNSKIEGVVKALNNYLADLNVLYVKIHNLHWNIEGNGFFQLHSVYEGYYEAMSKSLDEVAERILILGGRPAASMKEYLELASIKELESKAINSSESIEIIAKDFNSMLEQSREILAIANDANDEGTIDLISGFIGEYEKALWMFKAYKA